MMNDIEKLEGEPSGISFEGQKRWTLFDPCDNLPADGLYVVMLDHPHRKNYIQYPGGGGYYNRHAAMDTLKKIYKNVSKDKEAQWIELVK